MLYYLNEMSRLSMGPARAMTEGLRFALSNPFNPWAAMPAARAMASAADLFEHLTRSYGKPEWRLDTTMIDGVAVAVEVHDTHEDRIAGVGHAGVRQGNGRHRVERADALRSGRRERHESIACAALRGAGGGGDRSRRRARSGPRSPSARADHRRRGGAASARCADGRGWHRRDRRATPPR